MRWEDQPQRLLDRKTLWNELLLALEVCDLPEVSVGAFEVSVVPPVMALGCAGDTAVSGDGEAQDVVDILPALSLVTEADTRGAARQTVRTCLARFVTSLPSQWLVR